MESAGKKKKKCYLQSHNLSIRDQVQKGGVEAERHQLNNWNNYVSCYCCITSVVSDSVRPHRQQHTRLPRPWGISKQEHWSELPFPSPQLCETGTQRIGLDWGHKLKSSVNVIQWFARILMVSTVSNSNRLWRRDQRDKKLVPVFRLLTNHQATWKAHGCWICCEASGAMGPHPK